MRQKKVSIIILGASMIEKSNLFDNEIVKGTPILSPKVDYVFKLLLGDEKNIEILRSFLKATTDLSDDELNEINN